MHKSDHRVVFTNLGEDSMAVQTITTTVECPECFGEIELSDVMQNEIVQCSECGVDLEIIALEPVTLELAPEEDEDWGE